MERAIRKRGGDADYILALYDASPRALTHIGKAVAMLDHREAVTIEAAYAAQIARALSEGCGSCLQIHVDMASKAGVKDDVIAAMIRGDETKLTDDAKLAMQFAWAVIGKTADELPLRAAVRERWGEKGVVDLSIATQASRFLSMFKYGFGHATACSAVVIGGRAVAPGRG